MTVGENIRRIRQERN